MTPDLRGKVTDYGDLIHVEQWIVKGRTRPRRAWHHGAPTKTRPEDRIAVVPQPYSPRTGKVDLVANLHADKKIALLGFVEVDEMGNPTGVAAAGVTYATDDTAGTTIVLTDNGDGTGVVAAVGPLGSAQVTSSGTDPNGDAISHVETFNVIAGDGVGFVLSLGPEEEVTPDA